MRGEQSNDYLNIINKRIVGINNPKLMIHYQSKDEYINFVIIVDGVEYDFNLQKCAEINEFVMDAVFPSNAKKVEVFIKENEVSTKIWSFRNAKWVRILSRLENIVIRLFNKIKSFFMNLLRFTKLIWRNDHFIVSLKELRKYFYDFRLELRSESKKFYNPFMRSDYLDWININEKPSEYKELPYQPLISVLIPVFNVPGKILKACINSVLMQTYPNFEICLVDDCSTKEETIAVLKELETIDERIKIIYREENGHISKATNDALRNATGEFVALMDNDDLLANNALFENIRVINEHPEVDFIYSDEDKIDFSGKRCEPHFKPDFSPDTLMSMNYICHFAVIRKQIIDDLDGFTIGLEGAQDYDLFLRITEKTNHIHHISKILYHWRMIEGSTSASMDNKDYAADKGKLCLENALKRRGILGEVQIDPQSSYYIVKYHTENPLVSIIIPTRDYADITRRCLESIYEKTTYKNFEILLVNNRSKQDETFVLIDEYTQKYKNFKCINADMDFNYSKINNLAVKESSGEVLVLLNNDTEVITNDWLENLVGYAIQKHIGTVGAKLLYPDFTVQHAGIIMGLGGVASHAYIGSSRNDAGAYGRLCVPYNYSGVTAACLAIRKELYVELGQLDEYLEVAYNDVDLNLKALSMGKYNVLLPQVELIHHESKSRGLDTNSKKYKRFLLEQQYMVDKWQSGVQKDLFYNPNFSYKGWFVLDKRKGK